MSHYDSNVPCSIAASCKHGDKATASVQALGLQLENPWGSGHSVGGIFVQPVDGVTDRRIRKSLDDSSAPLILARNSLYVAGILEEKAQKAKKPGRR